MEYVEYEAEPELLTTRLSLLLDPDLCLYRPEWVYENRAWLRQRMQEQRMQLGFYPSLAHVFQELREYWNDHPWTDAGGLPMGVLEAHGVPDPGGHVPAPAAPGLGDPGEVASGFLGEVPAPGAVKVPGPLPWRCLRGKTTEARQPRLQVPAEASVLQPGSAKAVAQIHEEPHSPLEAAPGPGMAQVVPLLLVGPGWEESEGRRKKSRVFLPSPLLANTAADSLHRGLQVSVRLAASHPARSLRPVPHVGRRREAAAPSASDAFDTSDGDGCGGEPPRQPGVRHRRVAGDGRPGRGRRSCRWSPWSPWSGRGRGGEGRERPRCPCQPGQAGCGGRSWRGGWGCQSPSTGVAEAESVANLRGQIALRRWCLPPPWCRWMAGPGLERKMRLRGRLTARELTRS